MSSDDTTETPVEGTDSTTGDEEAAVEATQVAPVADEGDEARPSRREAKYRRQLRDTEAERDQLAARLDAMRRSEAERIAGRLVAEPSALWAAGVDLADLLDADGAVDPDAVRAATNEAMDKLGLRPNMAGHVPGEGRNVDLAGAPRFQDAFGPG